MKSVLLLLWYVVIVCNCGIAQIVPKTAGATVLRLTKDISVEHSTWPQIQLNVGFTDRQMHSTVTVQRDQIQLLENGVPQRVNSLGKADMAASICILIDTSISMKEHWSEMLKAVEAFVTASNLEDEFAILSFDRQIEVAQQFTTDRARVTTALRNLAPGGSSALFDAVAIAAEQATPHGSHPLKVVAVFSDGGDNYSYLSLSDLLRRLRYGNASIVSSVIMASNTIEPSHHGIGDQGLNELAVETGGMAFTITDPRDSEPAGIRLAEDVRNRRELQYTTDHDARDGKLRKLEVKVQLPPGTSKVKAQVRQGFYAPAN